MYMLLNYRRSDSLIVFTNIVLLNRHRAPFTFPRLLVLLESCWPSFTFLKLFFSFYLWDNQIAVICSNDLHPSHKHEACKGNNNHIYVWVSIVFWLTTHIGWQSSLSFFHALLRLVTRYPLCQRGLQCSFVSCSLPYAMT